ncbi:hypothetical protein AHAS_Ahas12G0084800 [Arachis hypogaea]
MTKKPIYFTSKTLQGAKLNYQRIEKFTYVMVMASRRLRSYFQPHIINICINQSIYRR